MFTFYESVAANIHLGMTAGEAARLISDISRFFIADAIADGARRFGTGNFASDQACLNVHLSAFDYMAGALHERDATVPGGVQSFSQCARRLARSTWCKSTTMKMEQITSTPSRALAPVRVSAKRRSGDRQASH
jgi:hypothetical protein